MSSSISEIAVAVLGIGGTLASALLTQRTADRARLRELEHARQLKAEEREYATRQAQLEARRTSYAALNAGTRDYITVMANFWHALKAGEVTDELRSDLDRARRDHRLRHAEAQMMLPDAVMAAASTVNRGFGDLYGLLKRLDRGLAEEGEGLDVAQEDMRRLWDALWELRRVMRADLGITPPEQDL
ncbi:hypothetical protein ACFYZJ_18065 [Streptomyces sp. NPDC001848]|uniref:hypothetical protein n=1 Tax=Streptomyces sp. NPDC001848 TaxID=3364618 RepID=UPI003689A9D1